MQIAFEGSRSCVRACICVCVCVLGEVLASLYSYLLFGVGWDACCIRFARNSNGINHILYTQHCMYDIRTRLLKTDIHMIPLSTDPSVHKLLPGVNLASEEEED